MNSPAIDRVHRVELIISNILRIGVITSLSIIVAGTIVSFFHHPDFFYSRPQLEHLTSKSAAFPDTLNDVARGLRHFDGRAIVILGLLLLISTPVVRVAVSIFAFVYQRDPIFVAITSVVLLLLLLSFLVGKAGG